MTRTIVKKLITGQHVPLVDVLGVLDDPMFLLDGSEKSPTLEEFQAFNRIARGTLMEHDLLDAAREALFPLADLEKDSRDCRECRVLNNLLVPANEQPNPAWVGAM